MNDGRRTDPLPRDAGGVALRRLGPSDLAAFQAYRHDPEVGLYQGRTPMSDVEARAFIDEMSAAPLLRPSRWSQLGIADAGTMRLVGDVGLLLAADEREVKIGFTPARHAQGRGLGTAAVRAAIAQAFEVTGAQRVVAITDARNLPCLRLLERVGMQRTASAGAMFRGEPCVEHTSFISRHTCG